MIISQTTMKERALICLVGKFIREASREELRRRRDELARQYEASLGSRGMFADFEP